MKHILAVCAIATATVPGTLQALDLRVGDVYPTGHYMSEALTVPWMKLVEERLGDAVNIDYFPASQLGKGPDLLSLTKQGVIDVGLIVPAFTPDKLPLSAVAELPGAFDTGCAGTKAFYELATGDGFLAEKEFGANGLHVLMAIVLPPYQIFTKNEITGVDSLVGQKMYSTGGAKDTTVRALQAVPVRMATSELYEALSRGTIDGGLMGYGTALAYKVPEFAHFGTKGENFGAGVITYAVGQEKWESWPEKVRSVMDAAGREVTMQACATIDAGVSADMAKLEKLGMTLVAMPEADRSKVDEALHSVGQQWAEELDGRSLSGTETRETFTKTLEEKTK